MQTQPKISQWLITNIFTSHEDYEMVSALPDSIHCLVILGPRAKKLSLADTRCSHGGELKFQKSLYSFALHSMSFCPDTKLTVSITANAQPTYSTSEK